MWIPSIRCVLGIHPFSPIYVYRQVGAGNLARSLPILNTEGRFAANSVNLADYAVKEPSNLTASGQIAKSSVNQLADPVVPKIVGIATRNTFRIASCARVHGQWTLAQTRSRLNRRPLGTCSPNFSTELPFFLLR